ncbi:hypothetical protein [Noviherbaspirillum massiliense]|uniref:hypothetical protein n=1 Tax=Noviherbaspirillum massiliense TaxID=1465823 RepID=UPI0002EA8D7B|nr:hypothetical protein [Noviherbaspirillum massiliense]
MKWFYKWKLNRINAEIDALKKATASPLCDSYYTDHSRLRNLNRMAGRLQEMLAGTPDTTNPDQPASLS